MLDEIGQSFEDLSPALEVLAADILAEITKMFDTAGRGQWEPLKPRTIKAKARRGWGPQPLVATTTWKLGHGAEVGADYIHILVPVAYAVYHVSDQPRTIIPLRDPYDLGDEFLEPAYDRILDFIVSGNAS